MAYIPQGTEQGGTRDLAPQFSAFKSCQMSPKVHHQVLSSPRHQSMEDSHPSSARPWKAELPTSHSANHRPLAFPGQSYSSRAFSPSV